MHKKGVFFVIPLLLTIYSCNQKDNLIEVEIPSREQFNIEESDFLSSSQITTVNGPMDLPNLSYDFEEYEVLSNPKSVFNHYKIYHLNYANTLNDLIHKSGNVKANVIDPLAYAKALNSPITHNVGGHYNHILFWQTIVPIQSTPSQQFTQVINKHFINLDTLKKQMIDQAMQMQNNGWLWLVKKNDELIIITTTSNNYPHHPELNLGTPLLTIDLWEHAYIDTYGNNISLYLQKSLQHINWDNVENRWEQ